MSGGSSGSYVPSSKTEFDCETGTIRTSLSSVDLVVLPQHSVGDILIVRLDDNNIVVVENGNGEILGSVLHVNVNELKACIELGNVYSARIVYISDTSCTVNIFRS